ncbi:glycosyltransferase family 4 protein [Planctomycetota bacterium]
MFFKSLYNIRKNDLTIAVTTPPLLPFAVALACKITRSKCILRIEDVYPETLVATGIARPRTIFVRLLAYFNKCLYKNVDHITVLGRDMKHLITKSIDSRITADYTTIVPNWADLDLVVPKEKNCNQLISELELNEKFVVQCAGNMGRAQAIEDIFSAAEMLKEKTKIHFIFIGAGVKREWMKNEVTEKQLNNITILEKRPRSDQSNFLNACDIAVVSLVSGMKGAAVPSRLYNIMAAGKPIVAIVENGSEVSLVIEEEQIGWVTLPGRPNALADSILDAYSDSNRLQQMGSRARLVAEYKYTYNQSVESYCELIRNCL